MRAQTEPRRKVNTFKANQELAKETERRELRTQHEIAVHEGPRKPGEESVKGRPGALLF